MAIAQSNRNTCPSGHPYDYVDSHGYRKCHQCRRRVTKECHGKRHRKVDAGKP